MKIKQKSKKKIMIISLVLIISLGIVFALNSNLEQFYNDSRKDDGNSGLAQERVSSDFTDDGCGTGTMLDVKTGICWDKNLNHNGVTLQWAIDNSYSEPRWNDTTKVYDYPAGRTKDDYPAFKYCEELVLGGDSDWRLPTNNELMTLIDEIGGSGITCATLLSFGFTNCQNTYYWSSEEYKSSSSNARGVNFNNGNDYCAKSLYNYVVCAR